jgi:hypothetical protein
MDHGRLYRSRTDYVRSNATAGQFCSPVPDKGVVTIHFIAEPREAASVLRKDTITVTFVDPPSMAAEREAAKLLAPATETK